MSVSICSRCDEIETKRVVESKKSRNIKKLKSRIVLYKEANSNENVIEEIVEKDLQKSIDAVLIIETTMKIPSMKRLVTKFSRIVKAQLASTII